MILDERNEFADANTAGLQGTAGTELVGDVIDLGLTGRDISNGQPLYLVIVVDTEVDSAADGSTCNFILASDASATIATDGSASEHGSTGAIAEASLTAGAKFVLPVGQVDTFERYLGVLVTRAVATVTAGAVSAFLTMDPTGWKAYPNSANVADIS